MEIVRLWMHTHKEVHYIVRSMNGTERHLYEPVTTEWGKVLQAEHKMRSGNWNGRKQVEQVSS